MKKRLLGLLLALCMTLGLGVCALGAEEPEAGAGEETAGDGVYTEPEELGTDPLSFIFELNGELYQLPAPYSAFEANGWIFEPMYTNEWPETIEPGERKSFMIFWPGDEGKSAFGELSLQNYADEPVPPEECYAVYINATYREPGGPSMSFPEEVGPISLDMAGDELTAVIDPSEVLYYVSVPINNRINYNVYLDPDDMEDPLANSNIGVTYSQKDDAVQNIHLYYKPDTLPY